MPSVLRNLPTVTELLESPSLRPMMQRVSRSVVMARVRRFLDDMRTQVQSAAASINIPPAAELAERIAQWIASEEQPAMVPVVNATGTLVHPQLGGVPLAEEAIQAAAAIARGYASVDYDLTSGEPAERFSSVAALVRRLTGAEDAIVVNTQAAALHLTLGGLARGREVIVARGHCGEEDGYRLADVVASSGAILREIGATNRTRASDYTAAIGPQTAALLHVHPSSYSVVGCADECSLPEVIEIARRAKTPVIDYLPAGALIDLARYRVCGEPTVGQSVEAGADIVLLGGDKLLGGPQCGVIAGRQALVEQIGRQELMTAMRADKLTVAALAATLRLYQDAELAERSIPLLSLLSTSLENLRLRAERLAAQFVATGAVSVEIREGRAPIGLSALARYQVSTVCVVLTSQSGSAESLASALRTGMPAVIGRIENKQFVLDLRSVPPREDAQIVAALEALRPKGAELPAPELVVVEP